LFILILNNIECNEFFNKEEANLFIKTFEEFSDETLERIRYLTNNIPLYISFLKESDNESPTVRALRNKIKSLKKSNSNKNIIEKYYKELLSEKIQNEIRLKIQNYINNYYKNFSDDDKADFASIIAKLNDPNFLLDTNQVINLLDYQLMSIEIDEFYKKRCRIKSIYPNLLELYDAKLDKKIIKQDKTSELILNTLNQILKNDNEVAGYHFESTIFSYLLDCLISKNPELPKNLEFIKELENFGSFDLFDYFKIKNNSKEYELDLFNKITKGFLFKNKTHDMKYIDGGMFVQSENFTIDLYTYDTTIADKSSEFPQRFESIVDDIKTSVNNLQAISRKLGFRDEFNFKKHYFIMGIDFLNEDDRKKFSTLSKEEDLRILSKRYSEKVEKMKEVISKYDPVHFGIIEAKIKSLDAANKNNKRSGYSIIFEEVNLDDK